MWGDDLRRTGAVTDLEFIAQRYEVALAVGETVILLHLPLFL